MGKGNERVLIKFSPLQGPAAIEKEKEKERKYAANSRRRIQDDPKAHAAYKEKLKKYREEKKVLYQIDPVARKAAKIQKRIRDQKYEDKRKLKRQQLRNKQQKISPSD